MRKLILQMQTSIDGYVSTGPNDEQKWVTWDLNGIMKYVVDLLDSTDTILIGRKLAVDYIPFWQNTFTKPQDTMYEFAKRIVSARKIVFTKTLEKSLWKNTELATGDLTEEVIKLKNQEGKDMVVYGGSSFVSSLIKEGLIDEFHFYVNPVVLGKGEHIFGDLNDFMKLKLKNSVRFDSGNVMLTYNLI